MKKIILVITFAMLVLSLVLWLFASLTREAAQPTETFGELPQTQPTSTADETLFTELVDETPDTTFAAVLELLYLDIYKTYTCAELGPEEQTLMITAKYVPNANGLNTLEAADAAVLGWESRMLIDVGHLVYPAYKLGTFTEPLTFAAVPGTTLRSATATVGGETRTVAYSWLLNYILISTSLDCLEETMEKIYEHHV